MTTAYAQGVRVPGGAAFLFSTFCPVLCQYLYVVCRGCWGQLYVIDEGTFDVFIKKADVETKVGEMVYTVQGVPTNVNTQKLPACKLACDVAKCLQSTQLCFPS